VAGAFAAGAAGAGAGLAGAGAAMDLQEAGSASIYAASLSVNADQRSMPVSCGL
jgi:hypothetical protein